MATLATTVDQRDTSYEGDFAAWVDKQRELLLAGRLAMIDAANIAEELRGLAASDFRALTSAITNVLTHMAKWDFQLSRRSRRWTNTIAIQRHHTEQELDHSPSFRSGIDEASLMAWRDARRYASSETNLPLKTFPTALPLKTFPTACPYKWDEIMTRPFVWPGDEE